MTRQHNKDVCYDIEVLLLAAGQSLRMPEHNKLLLDFAGQPLVRHVAETLRSGFRSVTVVLGYEGGRIKQALDGLDVAFVVNSDFKDGQQNSVLAGLQSLQSKHAGIMVALADLPRLTREDYGNLSETFFSLGSKKIVVPFYGDQRGNPVIVPAAPVQNAIQGNPAFKLRSWIDQNPDLMARYEAPNDRFMSDVDTQDDWSRIRAEGKSAS